MNNRTSQVYLGRQAVIDRQGNTVGYELLFRAGPGNAAEVADDIAATAEVITHAFGAFGLQAVVGDLAAFINVSRATLMSATIEALPADRVVIELLESIRVDAEVLERCRQLKAKGYRLALDDFVAYSDEYEPLLGVVDIVKVDILLLGDEALATLVRRLRRWPVYLLAEKVDTPRLARRCRGLGFNLFQGFFFERPVTLSA